MGNNVGAGVFSKGIRALPMRVSLEPEAVKMPTESGAKAVVVQCLVFFFFFKSQFNKYKSDYSRRLALAIIISSV